jgi:uncharacterized protein (TIGR02145 family)
MIGNAVPASSGSTYRWVENGNVLSGNNQATYTVPTTKATGIYTYVRQSKSAGCSDWQSSNEFTVTVFACTFTAGTKTGATATFVDPRDGKSYKTVVMSDNKTWFAQNLNYTKDLTYNAYAVEANGKHFTSAVNGIPAIGSYWCPGAHLTVMSGDEASCNVYGAIYTWETAMMVDGKWADDTKSSTAWDESWVSVKYFASGTPGTNTNANANNARGKTSANGGGRGICPMGWHVPTAREWALLLDVVDGSKVFTTTSIPYHTWTVIGSKAGKELKSTYTLPATDLAACHNCGAWQESQGNIGVDTYGFSIQPSGGKMVGAGLFSEVNRQGGALSSSCQDANYAVMFGGAYNMTNMFFSCGERAQGGTVRCMLD